MKSTARREQESKRTAAPTRGRRNRLLREAAHREGRALNVLYTLHMVRVLEWGVERAERFGDSRSAASIVLGRILAAGIRPIGLGKLASRLLFYERPKWRHRAIGFRRKSALTDVIVQAIRPRHGGRPRRFELGSAAAITRRDAFIDVLREFGLHAPSSARAHHKWLKEQRERFPNETEVDILERLSYAREPRESDWG